MITILPLNRVILTISVTYAIIVAAAIALTTILNPMSSTTIYGNMQIALAGATILNLTILGFIYFAWEFIWNKFPSLNTILFPNLNGVWDIKIRWNGINNTTGIVDGTATIKQDFIKLSMEVSTRDSDSETLIAQPRKNSESGRPILYYVYRVIPKETAPNAGHPYEGSAILKFSENDMHQLSGNYFTSQRTNGHFSLTRKTPTNQKYI